MKGRGILAVGLLLMLLLVLMTVAYSPEPELGPPSLPADPPLPQEMVAGLPVPPLPPEGPESVASPEATESGTASTEAAEPVAGPEESIPEAAIRDVSVRNEPDVLLATPVRARVTGALIAVARGRAAAVNVRELTTRGIQSVTGTVEVKVEREPELEEGLPVGITGRVVEKETGLPVPNAEVIIRSAFYVRAIFYDHHLYEVARAVTDPEGEFSIGRLHVDPVHFGSDGLVYLSVTSPDHAPHPAIPLSSVTAGYENRLDDLPLSRERYTIRGRVIDVWEGKPVVGGRVIATGVIQPINYPKDQREALFLSSPEAVTDEEGRFVLENVGPGTQMLTVHGGDDCLGYLSIQVPWSKEVVMKTRQIRGRIEGRVIDSFGDPVELATVDGGENTTHTFADGSFVLENFRGDVIPIRFDHTDFQTLVLPGVLNGTAALVVRMESKLPRVHLDVREQSTGAPVKAIQIRFLLPPGQIPPPPQSPHYLSEEGLHEIRLPVGAVQVLVTAGGREATTVELAGVRDGDTISVFLK
jgi:hypothetical protein